MLFFFTYVRVSINTGSPSYLDLSHSYHISKAVFAPFDIKGFIGCEFEQVFVDLSDETREIIFNLQDEFEQKAIEIDDIMRKEIPNSRHQNSISKIYDKREDIFLKKLGSFIERPMSPSFISFDSGSCSPYSCSLAFSL